MIKKKKEYTPNISELIDLLSVFQIREVKSNKDLKAIKKQISNIKLDLKNLLKTKKNNLDSKMIRKLFLISIINLMVWDLKDKMLLDTKKYNKYLKKALELNTIRNATFNIMMKKFNEFDVTRARTETLGKKNRFWHNFLMRNIKKL